MTRISRRTFVANTAAVTGAGLLAPWHADRKLPPEFAPEISYELSPITYTFATTNGAGQTSAIDLMAYITAEGSATVPEPSSFLLLAIGLAFVGLAAWQLRD